MFMYPPCPKRETRGGGREEGNFVAEAARAPRGHRSNYVGVRVSARARVCVCVCAEAGTRSRRAAEMGDSNDTAASTCMWDDEDCKMEDWGLRLVDTEYISMPFVQWGNIVILLWTLLLAFSTKYAFSLPFIMFDKKTKRERQAYRVRQRKKRDDKKRRMKKLRAKVATTGGGLASLVVAASFQEGGDSKSTEEDVDGGNNASDGKALEMRKLSPSGSSSSGGAASSSDVAVTVSDVNEKFPVFRSFDHQIVLSDNKAMCVAYASFVVAVMLACSGSRIPLDYDDDPLQSLIDFLLYSSIAYMLLLVACVMQTKLLLIKLNVRKALLNRNISVALTFAGVALASAVNLRASMMGSPSSRSFAETLGVTVMYFVFGQMSVLIFGWVFQTITTYDDQRLAMEDNPASGIKWASNLVSLAVISSAPIERTSELASFWAFTAIGSVFLLIYDYFVSLVIVPGNLMQEIAKDRNWGYSLICAAILLTTAISFESILKDLPCPGSDEWDKYIASFAVPGADLASGSTGNSTR